MKLKVGRKVFSKEDILIKDLLEIQEVLRKGLYKGLPVILQAQDGEINFEIKAFFTQLKVDGDQRLVCFFQYSDNLKNQKAFWYEPEEGISWFAGYLFTFVRL